MPNNPPLFAGEAGGGVCAGGLVGSGTAVGSSMGASVGVSVGTDIDSNVGVGSIGSVGAGVFVAAAGF